MNDRSGRRERRVQRTLVVTVGELAHEAGRHLEKRVRSGDAPGDVIAIVITGPETPAPETKEAIIAALTRISQMATRTALARRGWTLDRLDEVALILLLDLDDDAAGSVVEEGQALAESIVALAQRRFNVTVAPLAIALVPRPEEATALDRLAALAAAPHVFVRGVVALSLVNAMGLCLANEATLAVKAAHLVHALATTPLRDAPEWVQQNTPPIWTSQAGDISPETQNTPTIQSMGVATWEWSPAGTQLLLARHWVGAALEQWLHSLSEAEQAAVAAQAQAWPARQALAPDALARQVGPPPLRVAAPAPASPAPWQVRERLRPLLPPADTETAGREEDEQPAAEPDAHERIADALADVRATAGAGLHATGRDLLDDAPVAGVARVEAFARELRLALEVLRDRLAGRQQQQAERLAALAARRRQLAADLAGHLDQWPRPTPRAWLAPLLRPWRWPRLALRYRAMMALARRLAQVQEEERQWQWQQAIGAALAGVYEQLEAEVCRLRDQAEEVGDMLRSLRRTLAEETVLVRPFAAMAAPADTEETAAPSPARRLDAHYAALTEAPRLEAERAAAAVGGLGQQLTHLDDAVLDALVEAGKERMAAVLDYSAVDALSRPGEVLPTWWQRQWEDAAPLWRYDEAQLPEAARAHTPSLTLVCGADALALRDRLGLAKAANTRWLATGDRQRLVVLRAQGGIPIKRES